MMILFAEDLNSLDSHYKKKQFSKKKCIVGRCFAYASFLIRNSLSVAYRFNIMSLVCVCVCVYILAENRYLTSAGM